MKVFEIEFTEEKIFTAEEKNLDKFFTKVDELKHFINSEEQIETTDELDNIMIRLERFYSWKKYYSKDMNEIPSKILIELLPALFYAKNKLEEEQQ